MKAILYARVSTQEQGKTHLGLDAQIHEMKHFCQYNNIEIVDVRTEVVSGGYPLERRPVLKKAFNDSRAIKDCYIITSRIDRLARKSFLVEKLLNDNVKFKVVECGIQASTLEIKMKAIFAEDERIKGADRTRRALQAKKLRNEPMGFKLPVQKAMFEEIHNSSIKVIKGEADSFAQFMRSTIEPQLQRGMNFTDIANYLNEHNFKTQRNGKWWPQSVKNIVMRWD